MVENVWLGTTVKLAITVKGTPQVNLGECLYDVYVWASPTNDKMVTMPKTGVVHRKKVECRETDSETCIAEVQTPITGKGYLIARVEVQVPDTDCASQYRIEIDQVITNVKVI